MPGYLLPGSTGLLPVRWSIIHWIQARADAQEAGTGGKMVENLPIEQDLVKDLLGRLSTGKKGREAAIEAIAVSTGDEDWRPDELIEQGGIMIIRDLLKDKNLHIVLSALEIIIAIAASGHEEALISEGVIACLDTMQDTKNPAIREKVREALALLQPEVDEAVISKPQDEY
jgi:hypothetical protein